MAINFNPPAPHFSLRPYQVECIDAIKRDISAGHKHLLVALPTGTGKTVCFARLPDALGITGRTLVLAHREELLDQASDKFKEANPKLTIGIEQAKRKAFDSDIVIASVPTIQGKRLEKLDPNEFDLVIIDEAHHAVAQSYQNILNHIGRDKPTIGFTATPKRGDNIGLSGVFSKITYESNLPRMISDKYLVPISGYKINTNTDISDVKSSRGDFIVSQLSDAINTYRRNLVVVKAIDEIAGDRRALAFCADVLHARDLTATLNKNNIESRWIYGGTPKDERKQVLSDFANGKIKVLCNCMVLTEGFDDPGIDCILMCRPTKSSLLYTQMIGRGTRLHKDKKDLLVIDFVDNSSNHELNTAATIFGLPPKLNLKGKDPLAVKQKLDEYQKEFPWLCLDEIELIDDLELASQKIDFFNSRPLPEISSGFNWMKKGEDYLLSLPNKESIGIIPTRLDTWIINILLKDKAEKKEVNTLNEAIHHADSLVLSDRRSVKNLIKASAKWRKAPASDKQKHLLKKLGVQFPDEITKGQAANIITLRFS